jgi:phage-related protein
MDLFEIVGKLSIDGVEKAEKELGGVSGTASKVGGVLKGVGKGILAVTGAVATGSVALVKSVSSAYGELQQSIGGVETLFKDSADTVIENANKAFKTAGISANSYMQQVTSFSASLLQAVGGDTKKACDVADMAIIDMSDNANKMGTSMESIQNAYQGFAKQNYTMLDNLKLGYGGTKGEMERLLADASKISGIKYDISNLSDVYNAIHIIQGELGITGTTAKESAETISGSFGSMQGAWQNFIAGLGDPNADMRQLVENLASTIQGAVSNVTPVIDNMVAVLPTVVDALIDTISSMLPTLIQTFTELITNVINAITELLPEFIPLAVDCILTVVDALVQNLPLLIEAGILLIQSLLSGLAQSTPTLVPAIIDAVILIVEALINNIDLLIDAGIQLILGVADGLIQATPVLIEKAPIIIQKLVNALIKNFPKVVKAGGQLIGKLAVGLVGALGELLVQAPKIISTIVKGIKNGFSELKKSGRYLIEGIWSGISGSLSWIKSKISGWVGNVTSFIKKLFGINSPSTLFRDEIGVFLAQGIGEGITKDDSAEQSIKGKMKSIMDIANTSVGSVSVGVNDLVAESPMQKYQLAFNGQMGSLNDGFERLISLVGNYLPEITENSSKELSVTGDKLVLGISRKMDSQLGRLAIAKGRGNI